MTAVVRLIGGVGLLVTQCAKSLIIMHHKRTLEARVIQSAVRLTLPDELMKHAVAEGTKAFTKFSCY